MNFPIRRRRLATAALCLLGSPGLAWAQSSGYPKKPIRFIVPYATGGSTTNIARLVGQKLNEAWGQPVIVDNVPGGNTVIGTAAAAKSAPDGYTILLGVSSHVLIPLLVNAPYDPVKDFSPVASVGSTETILVVYPGLPLKTLSELIAYAKSKPEGLTYATGGAGSATHLAQELFNGMAGIKARHIPYKGAAPALVDLAGGQVDMSFAIPSSAIPLIKGGRLRAIAVTGDKRLPALPDVPTFKEAGMPNFEMRQWYGVIAPAHVPADVLEKLSSEIAKIAAAPDFKDKLEQLGMSPYVVTGSDLGRIMNSESEKFARIIREAHIKVE